jgi:hypothetical protein
MASPDIVFTVPWDRYAELVILGIGAIGTVTVALLAIFGADIRAWLCKPRIGFEVGQEVPCVQSRRKQTQDNASQGDAYTEIRLKVTNSGRTTAKGCKVLVEAVYEPRAGSDQLYPYRTFSPKPLLWHDETTAYDVIPHVSAFVAVANIRFVEQRGTAGAIASPRPRCSLIVLVPDEKEGELHLEIRGGHMVLPFVLCGDNVAPKGRCEYLEIQWKGEKPTDIEPKNLSIRLLEESEFRRRAGDRT